MVDWHLLGWYGWAHAHDDAHTTRLVQSVSTSLLALVSRVFPTERERAGKSHGIRVWCDFQHPESSGAILKHSKITNWRSWILSRIISSKWRKEQRIYLETFKYVSEDQNDWTLFPWVSIWEPRGELTNLKQISFNLLPWSRYYKLWLSETRLSTLQFWIVENLLLSW